jgi:hypothetical protein
MRGWPFVALRVLTVRHRPRAFTTKARPDINLAPSLKL